MAGAIRYRMGIDAVTGEPISGVRHLVQSLGKIWTTRLDSLPMLLDFGNNLRGLLSEDIEPALSLAIYNEMVLSAARWEPEYELTELQLVLLKETGTLGLRHGGLYYPEGRLGNYEYAVPLSLPAAALVGGAAA
jgi:phage baseplate assembly protein W